MRTLLVAAVAVILVACSGGVAPEETGGETGGAGVGGGSSVGMADAGAKASACDPLVPHADASPDGC